MKSSKLNPPEGCVGSQVSPGIEYSFDERFERQICYSKEEKRIIVMGKEFTSIDVKSLCKNFPDISVLKILGTRLSAIPFGLEKLKNLKEFIFIPWNASMIIDYTNLPRMNNLEVLNITHKSHIYFPLEICRLTSLKSLVLGSVKLTGVPAEIGNLTSLESFYLTANDLTFLPEEICSLNNLKYLHIGNNKLTTLPSKIGNLTSLETLDLNNNDISYLPPEIGNLKSLKFLYLRSNKLTALPAEIGNLTNLDTLYLETNNLTTLPKEIGNMKFLKSLLLRDNCLASLPSEIGNLTNLVNLNVAFNNFDSIPASIGNLHKNLKTLDLSKNSKAIVDKGNVENYGIAELREIFGDRLVYSIMVKERYIMPL